MEGTELDNADNFSGDEKNMILFDKQFFNTYDTYLKKHAKYKSFNDIIIHDGKYDNEWEKSEEINSCINQKILVDNELKEYFSICRKYNIPIYEHQCVLDYFGNCVGIRINDEIYVDDDDDDDEDDVNDEDDFENDQYDNWDFF